MFITSPGEVMQIEVVLIHTPRVPAARGCLVILDQPVTLNCHYTARRYASAVYDTAVYICLSVCVCYKSVFYYNGEMD